MWGKTKHKRVDFDRHLGKTTMIASGTQILGDIKFEGGLLVEGLVRGNVYAEEGCEALLRISESGEIRGEIRVPNIVINGQVFGDVYSSVHVELAAKAIVNGNVNYNLIEMVMGAEVNGALVHLRDNKLPQRQEAPKPQAQAAPTPAPAILPATPLAVTQPPLQPVQASSRPSNDNIPDMEMKLTTVFTAKQT